jgi:hypothetical protein
MVPFRPLLTDGGVPFARTGEGFLEHGAEGGNRTRTVLSDRGTLSPLYTVWLSLPMGRIRHYPGFADRFPH